MNFLEDIVKPATGISSLESTWDIVTGDADNDDYYVVGGSLLGHDPVFQTLEGSNDKLSSNELPGVDIVSQWLAENTKEYTNLPSHTDDLSGEDPSEEWVSSPEQQQMLEWVMGILEPGMTGGDPWELPPAATWDIPDPVTPTTGWYDDLDPSIMASLQEPWANAQDQMFEALGRSGSLGSARGGLSGSAGAALGEFNANRASSVGMDAWNMISPGLFGDYNAQLDLNRTSALNQWQGELSQNMAPFNAAVNLFAPSLPQLLIDPGTPSFGEQIIPSIMGMVGAYYGGPGGGMAGYGLGSSLTNDGAPSYSVPNNYNLGGYTPQNPADWNYSPSPIYADQSSDYESSINPSLNMYYDTNAFDLSQRGQEYDFNSPNYYSNSTY